MPARKSQAASATSEWLEVSTEPGTVHPQHAQAYTFRADVMFFEHGLTKRPRR